MKFSHDKYMSGTDPICREERQYALLLYNLLANQPEIDINGKTYYIIEAYYEVSLMRDFFYEGESDECTYGRREFNLKLLEYANPHRKLSDDKVNEKTNYDMHMNHWKTAPYLARCMMNAKPDIGILMRDETNHYYLCFVECKYTSDIGVYKSKDDEIYSQLEVQEKILDFLCDSNELVYEEENNGVQKIVKKAEHIVINHRGESIKGVAVAAFGNKKEPNGKIGEMTKGKYVDVGKLLQIQNDELNTGSKLSINDGVVILE